jgi:4-nitrophenyl phosphatase
VERFPVSQSSGGTITSKPSLDALRAAAARLGVAPKEIAVVGDDPLLKVPVAHRGRVLVIALETGPGGATAYDHMPPQRHPHMRLRRANELLALCSKLTQVLRDEQNEPSR